MAIDETTAQCVTTEVAGVSLVLDAAIPDPTGQTVLVAFTSGSDGLWTGCTQATVAGVTTLTFGTKTADLPTGYSHDFSGEFATGGGLVGIVRWPTAPALCGRQGVTITDNGGGTTKITFSAPQANLRTADALDFWQADMTALATPQANIAVTRIDDSNFTVSVAFTDMTGAVFATSHGAAAWYWNDSSFKGDFRYQGWLVENRPAADTETAGGCQQACLHWEDCFPAVVCFSPNGETFANGITKWFGDTGLPSFSGKADGVFGSRVQANVEFTVTDLLWQAPKCPCPKDGITYAAVMDIGGCKNDGDPDAGTLYFPPAPLIEARCDSSVLAGPSRDQSPPAFAAGIAWPAMTRPANPSTDPIGEFGWTVNSFYLPEDLPWLRYAAQRQTINANPACRFINFYEANFPPL